MLNVDELIADSDLVIVQTRAFITKHEQSFTDKRLLVDRLGALDDLDATNADLFLRAEAAHILQAVEYAIVHFVARPLRPEFRHLLVILIHHENL